MVVFGSEWPLNKCYCLDELKKEDKNYLSHITDYCHALISDDSNGSYVV